MGSNALSVELLASNPSRFRQVFAEEVGFVDEPYPASFVGHASVIAALYGLMIAASALGLVLRWKQGKLWFVRRSKKGVLRPNGAALVQLLLANYSALWICKIYLDIIHHAEYMYEGMETFQLLVFVPLSLAGWVQVYSTVCAIPLRQAVYKTSRRTPTFPSRLTRIVESAHCRNVLLFIIPSLYLVALAIPAVIAGRYQARAYRATAEVTATLKEVVEGGGKWDLDSFASCTQQLKEVVESYASLKGYASGGCLIILVWASLELLIFSSAAIVVWRILNRQVSQLRRTLHSAETLRRLSRAPPPLGSKRAASLADGGLFPFPLWKLNTGATALEIGESSRPDLEEVNAKLKKTLAFRKVFIIQTLATMYVMMAASAYSAFGVSGGFFESTTAGREIPLYVPFYGFLLPVALPVSILNTYFFLRRIDPAQPPPPPASTTELSPISEEGEWEPTSATSRSRSSLMWIVDVKRPTEARVVERKDSTGSAGSGFSAKGSGGMGWPSEWAKSSPSKW